MYLLCKVQKGFLTKSVVYEEEVAAIAHMWGLPNDILKPDIGTAQLLLAIPPRKISARAE